MSQRGKLGILALQSREVLGAKPEDIGGRVDHHIRRARLVQIERDLADDGTAQHGAHTQDLAVGQIDLHAHAAGGDEENVVGNFALSDQDILRL